MKRIFLSVFIFASVWILAQNSEIANAQKQLDEQNFTGAITTLLSVEKDYPVNTIDPNQLRELYYIKGKSYMAQNKQLEAAKAFLEVKKIEESPSFMVKNKETKEKLYFMNEEEAKSYADQNDSKARPVPVVKKYSDEIFISLNSQLESSSGAANKAYTDKNFGTASKKFLETYYIAEALGLEGKMYLYYAGIAAYQGEDFPTAEDLFDQIIELQYEGDNPEDNTLESAYRLKAYIKSNNSNWEELIVLAKEGLEKFPENEDLNALLATAYNKSGNDEAFIEQLKVNVQNDPDNALNYYNLGVLHYKDGRNKEEALTYFQKAIEKDPTYEYAYNNVARIIIDKDKEFNNSINELGTTSSDADKEEQIEKERKAFYQESIPTMEQAHSQFPDEKLYVQILKIMYGVIDDDANYKKYEALLRAM